MADDLTIRPATPADARFVWTVNNEPSVRAQSIRTEPIPWETHTAWFAAALDDDARRLFVTVADDAPTGVVRFDLDGAIATISVALEPASRGRGFGVQAIQRGCEAIAHELRLDRIQAFVRPDNVASQRAFERAGFRGTGERVLSNGVELDLMIWEPHT